MENIIEKTNETVAFINTKINGFNADYGIVLGSGLGGLINEIKILHELKYADIPNFPLSTVIGHSGKLIFGTIGAKKVVAMSGRFHYYEGYSMNQVAFPIRVMKFLGIKKLFLSNAAGGLNPKQQVGDLMIIKDHISLLPTNPLMWKNIDELGTRFPDMSEPYDKTMIEKALAIATENNFRCSIGNYVGVTGPCFESPAEYRYMHIIGGDAVGMSTVPEVIAARHMLLPVFAISVITDLGVTDVPVKITHAEVIKAANEAETKFTVIIKRLIIED
jgi:purine-nucleoside phosphorylase